MELCLAADVGTLQRVFRLNTPNAAVHQTEQQLALAFKDGAGAAAIWANLMRSNDANLMLATCTGLAVKTLEGRKACNMPVWLDLPNLAMPSRAR